MREMSDIFSSSKKSSWNAIFSIFILIIPLIFGQLAHAQKEPVLSSQPYKINGKEAKEYLMEKYHLKQEDIASTDIKQTPNGPSGKLELRGSIKPKGVIFTENTVQGRAKAVAHAFLKEEPIMLGISDLGEIQEKWIHVGEGYQSGYVFINYHRRINNLALQNMYIQITIGPNGDIRGVKADLIPLPAELYQVAVKETLSEADIRKIVENDLIKSATESPDIKKYVPKYMKLEKLLIPTPPYVVWKTSSIWEYTINAFTGEILKKNPKQYLY